QPGIEVKAAIGSAFRRGHKDAHQLLEAVNSFGGIGRVILDSQSIDQGAQAVDVYQKAHLAWESVDVGVARQAVVENPGAAAACTADEERWNGGAVFMHGSDVLTSRQSTMTSNFVNNRMYHLNSHARTS